MKSMVCPTVQSSPTEMISVCIRRPAEFSGYSSRPAPARRDPMAAACRESWPARRRRALRAVRRRRRNPVRGRRRRRSRARVPRASRRARRCRLRSTAAKSKNVPLSSTRRTRSSGSSASIRSPRSASCSSPTISRRNVASGDAIARSIAAMNSGLMSPSSSRIGMWFERGITGTQGRIDVIGHAAPRWLDGVAGFTHNAQDVPSDRGSNASGNTQSATQSANDICVAFDICMAFIQQPSREYVMIVSRVVIIGLVAFATAAQAADCPRPGTLGTSRILAVDAARYPRVGLKSFPQTLPLKDHEVVLTFDDGPTPGRTPQVLTALANECVRATFFLVGRPASEHAALVRRIAAEGSYGRASHLDPPQPRSYQAQRGDRRDRTVVSPPTKLALHGRSRTRPTTPFFRFPLFRIHARFARPAAIARHRGVRRRSVGQRLGADDARAGTEAGDRPAQKSRQGNYPVSRSKGTDRSDGCRPSCAICARTIIVWSMSCRRRSRPVPTPRPRSRRKSASSPVHQIKCPGRVLVNGTFMVGT